MEFITENWIFQNAMPWVGIWFTAMTIIFFVVWIIRSIMDRRVPYFSAYELIMDKAKESSIIISFVPLQITLIIAATIGWITDSMEMIRKKWSKRKVVKLK